MHDDLPSAGLEQPWTVAASSGLNFALSAASVLWRTPRRCLSVALGQLIVGREELNFGGYASSIMVMDARLRRRRSNLRRDTAAGSPGVNTPIGAMSMQIHSKHHSS
jgi:hypothetical protein